MRQPAHRLPKELMSRRGIIIANTGSPSAPTPEAVREYLSEFLTDPRICPMNPALWKIHLNAFILPKRSHASAEKYQGIWTAEGSPLSANMASLAAKLEDELDDVPVRHAMSYGSPSMLDAVCELRDEGCAELTVVSLYPQSAYSTAKVVEDKLHAALVELDWAPQLTFVENYHEQDAYLDAIAASVRDAGFMQGDTLLMAFHSIPMKDVNAGDTYPDQVEATTRAVAERLGLAEDAWRAGFQCRFDNRKWVGPSTTKVLQDLAPRDGRLFVVAPNFSIDCLETLYDIEVAMRNDYRAIAQSTDSNSFVYVPCLNDSDAHVRLLKDIVAA